MKISAIKNAVERYDLATLMEAENQMMEGEEPGIEVEGEDEGEQLTHILAAIYIRQTMDKEGCDLKIALRSYTSKVRESIS